MLRAITVMRSFATSAVKKLVNFTPPLRPVCTKGKTAGKPNSETGSGKMPALIANKINSFQGDYRFLSNFWPAPVTFEGVFYPTVEHAFQAAKTLNLRIRAEIRDCKTAADAKRLGRRASLRPDWEAVKLSVMESLVRQKFAPNTELAESLLATGNAVLIEGNTWGDCFWGVCRGEGENRLGQILMQVRAELRNAGDSEKKGAPKNE